jgi:hypothetical protein
MKKNKALLSEPQTAHLRATALFFGIGGKWNVGKIQTFQGLCEQKVRSQPLFERPCEGVSSREEVTVSYLERTFILLCFGE